MHIKRLSALLIVIVLLLSGCVDVVTESTETTSESVAPITSIRAQDDYYGYVNLETLQNITLEYGETQAGSFANIDTEQQLLESILRVIRSTEKFPTGSCEQIVRDAYLQYIDFLEDDAAQARACRNVEAELQKIAGAQTLDELMAIAEELTLDYGCATFSNLVVQMDFFDPDEYAVAWFPAGEICGVPLEEVNENTYLAEPYEKRIVDTLRVMGKSYGEAEKIAHEWMLRIIDVAWATDYEIANAADPFAYTTFMTNAELDAALSNVSIRNFEQMAGIVDPPYGGWLIMDKGQLTAIDALFVEDNLEELKAWAAYDFLAQYGVFITSEYPIYEEYFPISHETAEIRAIEYIHDTFPMVLSDLYVKDHYSEETDRQLTEMFEEIRESYRDLITGSDWISSDAKLLILQKLDQIRFITGGTALEQMEDDPGFLEVFGDDLFETRRNAERRDIARSIEKIGRPRERTEFGMPMHMVNACYGYDNTVTITVAICSAPFFDPAADYYTNLGGLGAVIAHEVGHAFDSNMIRYNANGVYDPSWLPPEDMDAFRTRNQIVREYFEKHFTVFDVYRVDGQLTLGENYADLGAMECITNIARTGDEYRKLFENYARIWCELSLNSAVIERLSEDPHSPAIIRVNAILATTDAFCELYGLIEGDGMYVPPEERISRWK
ncbi:MAG: M13 family metallopeptidase [Clostridiales bacterium]|nr:M13 family metallopeptidase [Clostridiales bacterium]